ncbi:MAG: hypothetical protein DSZ23_05985, partial [Thermodesulfatator sp.]
AFVPFSMSSATLSASSEKIAKAFKLPLLAKIPIDPEIRKGGDEGHPVVLNDESQVTAVFSELADKVAELIEKGTKAEN